MADTSDVLLKTIEEQWSQARQSEDQRATMTNYIIAISTAILGFIVNRGLVRDVLPLTILLVLLGVFGAIVSAKLYERFNLHVHRIGKYIRRLEELHPDAQVRQLQNTADEEHKSEFPRLVKLRLHWLWLALHSSIALLGVVTTVIALAR